MENSCSGTSSKRQQCSQFRLSSLLDLHDKTGTSMCISTKDTLIRQFKSVPSGAPSINKTEFTFASVENLVVKIISKRIRGRKLIQLHTDDKGSLRLLHGLKLKSGGEGNEARVVSGVLKPVSGSTLYRTGNGEISRHHLRMRRMLAVWKMSRHARVGEVWHVWQHSRTPRPYSARSVGSRSPRRHALRTLHT